MLLFLSTLALATSTDPAPEQPPLAMLSSSYTQVSPVVSEDLADAFTRADWSDAIRHLDAQDRTRFNTVQRREADFLWMWAHIHAGSPEKAAKRISALDGLLSVPEPYVALVRGELLLASDQPVEALKALDAVPEGSPIHQRALLQRAATLQELKRTAEATALYESLAEREDPAPGSALALWALAVHRGLGSPEAYPYLRRLWVHYPVSREGKRAAEKLKSYRGAAFAPNATERSLRVEQLMYVGYYDSAIAEADQLLAAGTKKDEATCRALYARGRSYYKKNQLSNSVRGFGDAGDRCVGLGEYGAKSLYLLGTAQFRRKQYTASANAYLKLPTSYAEHSMADDGYTRAGISLQENDELERAQEVWRKALDTLPEGDTVPEATWRLAWSLYLQGDTKGAIEIARRLAALGDTEHSDAGSYWAARWKAYPDVEDPTRLDPAGRDAAVAELIAFVQARPFSFYSILASSRLKELAPEAHEHLQKLRAPGPAERPWEVRVDVLEHHGIRNGVALARLGLAREALEEWDTFEGELTPDETAWLYQLRAAAGDWVIGHHQMRRWIRTHPLGTLGAGERAVVRVAYPDYYWSEVQEAAAGYRYDPRLFHALVREESNFNRRIVSFAGARGLSQLMPATARTTAGWMGRSITMDELFEPEKNLPIGARYLESVMKSLDGSPYAALAGYNAGPGRVRQWHGEWGNVPTDEFVERIPFRETRGYVKRVMGTWQTYRWYAGDGEPFYDLSAYNHKVLPER